MIDPPASGPTPVLNEKTGRGPVDKGKEGEEKSKEEAIGAGEKIRGEQITLELPSGSRTRPDLLTEKPDGSLKVREAKNGPSAELTPGQRQLKDTIESSGKVIPRGKNAEKAGLAPGRPIRIKTFEEDRC
jgi:hypothetical protein